MPLYRLTRPLFQNGRFFERGTLVHFEEGKQPSSAAELSSDDEKKLKKAVKEDEDQEEFDFDDPLIDPSNVEGKALSELQPKKGKK